MIVGSDTATGTGTVMADPRFDYTPRDRREKLVALKMVIGLQEVNFELLDRLRRAASGIDDVL